MNELMLEMMLDSAIAQGLFKLLLGVTGIILGRVTLMWMDLYVNKNVSNFSTWLGKADDHAKALYYAGRLIFVGLIIGAAIS